MGDQRAITSHPLRQIEDVDERDPTACGQIRQDRVDANDSSLLADWVAIVGTGRCQRVIRGRDGQQPRSPYMSVMRTPARPAIRTVAVRTLSESSSLPAEARSKSWGQVRPYRSFQKSH